MDNPAVIFTRELDAVAEALGRVQARRVLVLAPPSRRYVNELDVAIAGFEPAVFDGARVHVPIEVVDAAHAQLTAIHADTVVAIGGGSAIGLGKALRLRGPVKFVAVPTTYAGSEMTSMYGITTGRDKQTGRDERVRPDVVVYAVALTRSLPIALTVQSLCNAVAHVASVLSTGIDGDARAQALAGAAQAIAAIDDLLADPTSADARERAQRGASACAAAYHHGKSGAQHHLAHLLGGALRLEHAALHAVLLPHFIAHLRQTQPPLVDELERAVQRSPLDAYLASALVRAGAPVSLAELGAAPDAVTAALATKPELPAEIAMRALTSRS